MQIVVEYVLIENFLINWIVLKTTGLILHEKQKNVFLFCLAGAIVALAIPMLGLSTFGNFLLVFGFNCVFLPFSFKFAGKSLVKAKSILLALCTYYLSAFLYGGACYFFEGLIGEDALLIALLCVVLTYFIVKIVAKISKRKGKIEKCCFDVEISMGEKNVLVRGFLDTGNVLRDPMTGKDVTLINFETFKKLCSEVELQDVLLRSKKLEALEMSHFIKIQSIGSADKILVFQADRMTVANFETKKPILGLTFKDFKALRSDVILGCGMVGSS